jgi:hypothetical protein
MESMCILHFGGLNHRISVQSQDAESRNYIQYFMKTSTSLTLVSGYVSNGSIISALNVPGSETRIYVLVTASYSDVLELAGLDSDPGDFLFRKDVSCR